MWMAVANAHFLYLYILCLYAKSIVHARTLLDISLVSGIMRTYLMWKLEANYLLCGWLYLMPIFFIFMHHLVLSMPSKVCIVPETSVFWSYFINSQYLWLGVLVFH
jgi:hypothetical protein